MLAEHGFLSPEVADVAEVVESRYAPWLKLVRSINTRAVQAQYEVQIHSRFPPELVAAAAYMRTLTIVQAAVLLIAQGLDVPARILLRAGMESLFMLKAIERDRNVVNAIIAGDDEFRQKLFEKYARIDDRSLQQHLQEIAAENKVSGASQALKDWGVTRLSVEQMAAKADLTDLYLSTYPVLSNSAHTGIRDLERHLETNTEGDIIALRNEPCVDDLELLFLMAAEFLISALEAHAAIFKLDLGHFCDESKKALQTLKNAHAAVEGTH